MFEVTFLGTAAAVPSVDRGLSAILVDEGPHRFLVDCGEGTQRQIMKAGLGFRRLDKVLLTHGHLDHILGLGGLAGTLGLWRTTKRLTIHAGPHPLGLASTLLRDVVWAGQRPGLELDFVPLEAGCFFRTPRLRVHAFPVRHAAPDCFGFLFEKPGHRPMLPDRLEALGVTAGADRASLARGEAIRLPDGRRVEPEEVLGEERPGTRLAVVGDAESVEDLVEHVRGADLLVIEGTFMDEDEAAARERSHLTVGDAARLARMAGVGGLWLTHQSPRYRHEEVERAASAAFPGARVARDFDRIQVPDRPR